MPEALPEDVCPVHGLPWRDGRNMANAPLGRYCSYDGSMHPDEFMAYLTKPGTELTPTDKSYKVYISVVSDEPEQMRVICSACVARGTRPGNDSGMEYGREWMTYADAVERHPELREGYESHLRHVETLASSHPWHTETHWVQVCPRGERRESKFYFEHLSAEQRTRFVEMLNADQLTLRAPGYFYSSPFFMGLA